MAPSHFLIRIESHGTLPRRKMDEKSKAYTWVAYMLTHQPEEIRNLLKYGTPSDKLIKLSRRRVAIHVDKDDLRAITFPVTLSKSAGQKLLYKAAQDIVAFKAAMPVGMLAAYTEMKSTIKLRRSDATENVLMVAEAITSRGAAEFKNEILFAFDSINTWIKAKYGKTLGYVTIRKALELLESKFFITVREWGQRNVRHKATKIYVHLDSAWRKGKLSDADEWVLSNSAAMTAVYARESLSRQDVLEANFQNYMAIQDELRALEGPAWSNIPRLFPAADDTISTEPATVAVLDEIEFKEIWDDAYIDRLLGRLVPAMQENGTPDRTVSAGIRGPD
jgi:hypothetical protein